MKIEFYHELYTFFMCSFSLSFSFMLNNNILIFFNNDKNFAGLPSLSFFLGSCSSLVIHILPLIDDSLFYNLSVPIFEIDCLPAHPHIASKKSTTSHSVIPSHHYRRCRHCNKNKNLFDVIDNKSFWFKNHQPTIIYVFCAVQDTHPSYIFDNVPYRRYKNAYLIGTQWEWLGTRSISGYFFNNLRVKMIFTADIHVSFRYVQDGNKCICYMYVGLAVQEFLFSQHYAIKRIFVFIHSSCWSSEHMFVHFFITTAEAYK